jgi:hypothetical protein
MKNLLSGLKPRSFAIAQDDNAIAQDDNAIAQDDNAIAQDDNAAFFYKTGFFSGLEIRERKSQP